MPQAALKHLAKKAGISTDKAEHYWNKAKGIVKSEYEIGEDDSRFWALTTGITKKMMGIKESISFKEFLNEIATEAEPRYHPKNLEQLADYAIKNCSVAVKRFLERKCIYRGDSNIKDEPGVGYVVDPSSTERQSQNTTNYYTVILDNNPLCKDFPKRSRSFICTTSEIKASNFGSLHYVFPLDNVKIGSVHNEDMWDVQLTLFGMADRNIDILNRSFEGCKIIPSIEGLKEFAEALKHDEREIALFKKEFDATDEEAQNFLEEIWKAYSPKETGFTVETTKSLYYPEITELWVGGPVVMVNTADIRNFRTLLEERI